MHNETNENAEDAYVRERNHALELLDRVRDLVEDLPAPGCDTRIDWGHVGDLGHINELLTQVACFLMGVDESEL